MVLLKIHLCLYIRAYPPPAGALRSRDSSISKRIGWSQPMKLKESCWHARLQQWFVDGPDANESQVESGLTLNYHLKYSFNVKLFFETFRDSEKGLYNSNEPWKRTGENKTWTNQERSANHAPRSKIASHMAESLNGRVQPTGIASPYLFPFRSYSVLSRIITTLYNPGEICNAQTRLIRCYGIPSVASRAVPAIAQQQSRLNATSQRQGNGPRHAKQGARR